MRKTNQLIKNAELAKRIQKTTVTHTKQRTKVRFNRGESKSTVESGTDV